MSVEAENLGSDFGIGVVTLLVFLTLLNRFIIINILRRRQPRTNALKIYGITEMVGQAFHF